MKMSKTWAISVTAGIVGLILVFVIVGFYLHNNPNTPNNSGNVAPTVTDTEAQVTGEPQGDITLSEAFATSSLGLLTPGNKGDSSPDRVLHYTITGTVNWETEKDMQTATLTDISVQSQLTGYKTLTFPESHVSNQDYPEGIPTANMYPDGLAVNRNELNAIPNSGSSITIPIDQAASDYQDVISPTYGYFSFRVKLLDFATIKYASLLEGSTYNTTAAKVLAAAGLTKTNLTATLSFNLQTTFTDGTTATKPITIVLNGNNYGDNGMDRQDYQQ